jgi:hypothetical protein
MPFIDFSEVKNRVSFADAIQFLDISPKKTGNQWRGPCVACQTGGDRALVITEGKGYFCFADHKGGDQIALVAHVLGISAKDAAQRLAEHAGIVKVPSTSSSKVQAKSTVPESEGGGDSKLLPLSYLEADHEAVIAVGLDPEWCQANGVGYSPRGVCRGSIAIPFRDERGALLGYFAVQELTYVPPDFTTNVVPFEKRRA